MNVKKVSVIMPVYNAGKYLPRAIESVLGQTFHDFEFIIIDDGSTDNSLIIMEYYASLDSRITVLTQTHSGRHGQVRNVGAQIAKGEYLATMDADDISLPERLSRQVDFLDTHKDIVCLGSGYIYIDKKGRPAAPVFPPEENADIQASLLTGRCAICHPTCMVRRDAFVRIDGYNPDLPVVVDFDLFLRLEEIGKFHNLNLVLLQYRIHENELSARRRDSQDNYSKALCEKVWARKGITGTYHPLPRWRPGIDRHSQYPFFLKFGGWALQARNLNTALIYGMKAVARKPFSLGGWRLLLKTIIIAALEKIVPALRKKRPDSLQ